MHIYSGGGGVTMWINSPPPPIFTILEIFLRLYKSGEIHPKAIELTE